LARECANQKQSRKAVILKQNETDAFRFACALKTQEGFLEALLCLAAHSHHTCSMTEITSTNPFAYAFASDNTAPATPEALAMLHAASAEAHLPSYGNDPYTAKAIARLKEWFECDLDAYFVFSGTAANAIALASMRLPFESVFCTGEAHIEKDESAAPEFFAQGLKLHLIGDARGDKLDLAKASHILGTNRGMHSPQPRVISLSQSTEFGTLYSTDELARIRAFADAHKLHVHMDGARFANALAHSGNSPAQLSWRAGVDVLSLGGTKNGVCTSEVLIYFNKALTHGMLNRRKQGGQLLSKMRYLSAPWLGALDQFVARARAANAAAQTLLQAMLALQLRIAFPVQSNGIFVHLSAAQVHFLEARGWHFYWFYGANIYRFMCAWNTTNEALQALIADLARMPKSTIEGTT
jgi:threonine aldolase